MKSRHTLVKLVLVGDSRPIGKQLRRARVENGQTIAAVLFCYEMSRRSNRRAGEKTDTLIL